MKPLILRCGTDEVGPASKDRSERRRRLRGTGARPGGALAALLSLVLAVVIALDAFIPMAHAQSSGEIVVAQNNNGPGGFFRRLFSRRREVPQPQRQGPLELFPRFDAPAEQPRRERRVRTAAPQPREVAAVEKSPNAKRALVIGDFMAGALAKGLAETFRENANVVVIDAASGSSGLVRNDFYDWPASAAAIVVEQRPDAVLVMIGGNDRQGIAAETGDLPLGSDGWRTTYAARVAALADALKGTGKPVLWGGLVPVESSVMSRDYSSFNGIVREQLEAKGLRFVDMWNGFADEEGKYVAFGPDVSGQAVQLRSDDGLNFTRAGQRKLAYFVEQDLNDIFGGIASLLASTDAADLNAASGGAAALLIGPMVPLDALDLMGGDTLSGRVTGDKERGKVAEEISARLAEEDAEQPPPARADSYLWPLPSQPAASTSPPILPAARGPR